MSTETPRSLALLIARVGLGVIFVAHGWQKFDTNGLDATKAGFAGMGVPAPELAAYFSTFVELVGGAALILGLLTPVVAFLLFLDMLGAFFIVHVDKGVFAADGGYELVVALGVGALLLAVFGAGRFSADAILKLPGARATAAAR
ncbi:MAG TPA: DoxX family protein [Aldersonia sp.]